MFNKYKAPFVYQGHLATYEVSYYACATQGENVIEFTDFFVIPHDAFFESVFNVLCEKYDIVNEVNPDAVFESYFDMLRCQVCSHEEDCDE